MTTINDMIKKESGRKLEILKELKKYNKEGYLFMIQPGSTFKPKYRSLQKTDMWKKAKNLLLEYFTIDRVVLRCEFCGRLESDHIMHHVEYVKEELFSPQNIEFIHKRCHSKEHSKY